MPSEIAVPFRIDPNGAVAKVTDPVETVRQHLVSLIGTEYRERVMRPRYGTPTSQFLFGNNDDLAVTELEGLIQSAVETWEPRARIVAVHNLSESPDEATLSLSVQFVLAGGETLDEEQQIHTAFIDVGGTVTEVRGG